MYTEEYERRGFPLRDFLQKLILVIIFALILVWLLPKFISPRITATSNQKSGSPCTTSTCDTSGINALTSQIFADNLDKMKQAAISYYTDERLPQNVGDSNTMTLSDMIGKKLIIALVDKNNKACDVEKSYVKITKLDKEYVLKVNLKDSEKEDYILVHLGCYNYCEGTVCEKKGTSTPIKGAKTTTYVPIKGAVERGTYYPPEKVKPVVEIKYYCAENNGKYYDNNGNIVSYESYKKACVREEVTYTYKCVQHDGKYYDNKGNVVSYENYKKACVKEEETHKCVLHNGKYYDNNGNVVNKVNYIIRCQKPKCTTVDEYYFGKDGSKVTKSEFEKQCKIQEYLYEYKKSSSTKLSDWTPWKAWEKADCTTKNTDCNDKDVTCLKKVKTLKRKEQIGTYEKSYAKQRDMVVQTGSYQQIACSKYNYVEINKTIYATTTTTKYTEINTISSTTKRTTASWRYNGRVSYTVAPKDTATTIYKYAGADYSNCQATCATAPKYYYDSYTYIGSLNKVSKSTVATSSLNIAKTTTTSEKSEVIGYEASCGEYVVKTIPIYSTITVTEKAKRTEPLYGDVCYKSTKERSIITSGKTVKKWSEYNDRSLLDNGWTYTGNRKTK